MADMNRNSYTRIRKEDLKHLTRVQAKEGGRYIVRKGSDGRWEIFDQLSQTVMWTTHWEPGAIHRVRAMNALEEG